MKKNTKKISTKRPKRGKFDPMQKHKKKKGHNGQKSPPGQQVKINIPFEEAMQVLTSQKKKPNS